MKTLVSTLGFIAAAAVLVVFAGPSQEAVANARSLVVAPTAAQPAAASTQAPEQDDAQPMGTCLLCGSGSTGACSGARQCRGSRKACRAKGCKITGTGSCSTAANVKIC